MTDTAFNLKGVRQKKKGPINVLLRTHTLCSVNNVTRSACMGADLETRYKILTAARECWGNVLLNIRYLLTNNTGETSVENLLCEKTLISLCVCLEGKVILGHFSSFFFFLIIYEASCWQADREKLLLANSGDPDQMPHHAASDLGLHCLPLYTPFRVSRPQWVNFHFANRSNICV